MFRGVSAGKRVPARRRVTIDCRQRLDAGKGRRSDRRDRPARRSLERIGNNHRRKRQARKEMGPLWPMQLTA